MKYHRYRLTYPYNGNKIHQSRSLKKGVKKCYNDFKKLDGMKEGMFSVTNIDTKKIYTYRIRKKRKSTGGGLPNNTNASNGQSNELNGVLNEISKLNKKIEEINKLVHKYHND